MLHRVSVLIIALSIMSVFANSANAQIVEDGLMSYWSLDKAQIQGNTVKDSTGAHNGVIQGDPKPVTGKIGEALEFDGNKVNFIEVNAPESFDFNADFTWSAWIKTDHGGPGVILAKTGGPGTDDKGPKTWWIVDGVQSFDTGWVGNVKDIEPIADNKWHYIAIAATAQNGAIQYYVDGTASGKGQMAFTQFPEDGFENHLFIGVDGRADGEFGVFQGVIDELSVYNRVLTGAEILQNFQSNRGLSVEAVGKLAVVWGALKADR